MSRATVVAIAIMLAASQGVSGSVNPDAWSEYRNKFIADSGRVIDTANGNISHSEGQGYAMLLAVAAGDHKTFEQLWSWTRTNLAVRDDGLFAWKWVPETDAVDHIPDSNNATDGDLLIAWALGRASRRFGESSYGDAASRIARSIRSQLARDTPYGTLLLPGIYGFESAKGVVVNPSYVILPAYREMAQWDSPVFWKRLATENIDLLKRLLVHFNGLPPDWVLLDGKEFKSAPHAELRFGYDALRVPLYTCWQGDEEQVSLTEIADYWSHANARSWIALDSDEVSEKPLTDAHQAVRWLLSHCLPEQPSGENATLPATAHDYYGATLSLLAELAWSERNE